MHSDEPQTGTNIVRFRRRKPRVCIAVTGACFSNPADVRASLHFLLGLVPANTDARLELITEFRQAELICVNKLAH